MTVLKNKIIESFPNFSQEVEIFHRKKFETGDYPFLWIEDVANLWNQKMNRQEEFEKFSRFFCFLENFFKFASKQDQKFVETAIVENLFFQVSSEKAKRYWEKLPMCFQSLYKDFHKKSPC